jgi:hypothetical protein
VANFYDDSNDALDEKIVEQDEESDLRAKVASGDEAAMAEYAKRFQSNYLRALQPESIAFFVKLQEENPASWFMLKQVLQQNKKIKISSIERLIKKRIEEMRAVEARDRAARAAAGPSKEELRRLESEKSDLRAALWSQCCDIAKSPMLMGDFVRVAHRRGIVEEEHAIRSTYLSATSRLAIKDVVNVVREGAAAAGKSFVVDGVLYFIPEESVTI